jgi:uncharacterized membrane protein
MKALHQLKKKDNLPLLFILLVAFFLRFYKLGFESFWLDELHTMNEADPSLPLSQMFDYLGCCDQHPPLFFFCERFIFSILGRSESIGRLFPAIVGTVSVWAMYLLGKELLNKNLGLTAAAFTCVNYFNLYYSREARGYILVFLMAVLSLTFLIRLIKYQRTRDMWYYSLFALLAMYSHYYGIFLVCSHFCIAFIFLFFVENKKLYLKRFGLSGLIIAAGYAPWLPFVLRMSQIKSFWIGPVTQDFIFNFFFTYFGNSDFLKPILAVLLIYYLVNVFGKPEQKLAEAKNNPLIFSFVIFSVCLVVTDTLPYIRSVLVVPMLFDRYTIVVLPVFLAAIAYGLELIPGKLVKDIVFWIFMAWSAMLIVLTNRTYNNPHKTQFREMNAYMAADTAFWKYPILNEKTPWQDAYYINKFHYPGPVFSGPRAAIIDSLVHGMSPQYLVNGFWLIDAHGAADPATYLDPNTKRLVDSFFVLKKEQRWVDCWAQLYLSNRSIKNEMTTNDFPSNSIADIGEKVVAIWNGSVTSNPFAISRGDYIMRILAKGTPARDIFPHLVVSVNDKIIGDYFTTQDFQDKAFTFRVDKESDSIRVKIELVNDLADPQTHEDRNAFLKRIVFSSQ